MAMVRGRPEQNPDLLQHSVSMRAPGPAVPGRKLLKAPRRRRGRVSARTVEDWMESGPAVGTARATSAGSRWITSNSIIDVAVGAVEPWCLDSSIFSQ